MAIHLIMGASKCTLFVQDTISHKCWVKQLSGLLYVTVFLSYFYNRFRAAY